MKPERLKLVFCGTPAFAVPTLQRLHEDGHSVLLVVTQPDRPRGRGMELGPSPVKQKAVELAIPITQPEKIKNKQDFREQIEQLRPDAIIVVGYGRIIPQWMIDLPTFGNINLHASLLPKYRGAAPIQWAIANGETTTGVTTMRIDAGLDTGDILLQQEVTIETTDTALTLAPRLADIGADLMIRTLTGVASESIRPRPQDNTQATLAPTLKKEDGRIDFHRPAIEIWNRLRGFQPWPGAFTSFRGKNLNVWEAAHSRKQMERGELVIEANRLFVGCAHNTALELTVIQPEGKKSMFAREFIQGYRPRDGERLG